MRKFICVCIFYCSFLLSYSQCPGPAAIWKQLLSVETSEQPLTEKVKQVKVLQQQFLTCKYAKDSVYARILHRIGVFQYSSRENLNECIKNTIEAIYINRNGGKNSLPSFLANSYFNLGYYYKELLFYNESLQSFDSAAFYAEKYGNQQKFFLDSRHQRSRIYLQVGDYQKSIDEATLGLSQKIEDGYNDKISLLLIERAQAFVNLLQYDYAAADLTKSITILNGLNGVENQVADNYRIQATLYKQKKDYDKANSFYLKTIALRKKFGSPVLLAGDLMDAGDFQSAELGRFNEALQYYHKALAIADKENIVLLKAQINNNIGVLYKEANQLSKALQFYQKGLNVFIKEFIDTAITANPSAKQLSLTADKQMLYILLANKAEVLLLLYQQAKKPEFISQAKTVFYLTDKVLDQMRYDQYAETSKLYWRNRTREFYTNAITASFESGNTEDGFYFMEKSRAILLNDKLNELGAFAYLPPGETAKEQDFRIRIISLQQQFDGLQPSDKDYEKLQAELLSAKNELEKFVKNLEQRFPAYYQYKYSGADINIAKLKQYVAHQHAAYISYYETDSVVYAITVSEKETKFLKLPYRDFSSDGARFLQLCSDKQKLNSNYNTYAQLAQTLHQKLFAPLQITGTKVILSPDRLFLPFDAFVKNTDGNSFLIYDHTFSYTYSAGFLLKGINNTNRSTYNFLGIAPESFANNTALANLPGSAVSLSKIENFFSSSSIYDNDRATRANFLNAGRGCNMMHIYAHAIADSNAKEPRLFLHDSSVALSELPLIKNPPTQMVFLAACETNVGKQQTGEGVYSLARGFASVGVPSTVATLWKADNETMYQTSELFYQFIKKGLPKDEALRQAKIEFLKKGNKENQLPFYWASSVLFGNTDAVKLSSSFNYYLLIPAFLFLFVTSFYFIKKRRAAKRQPL